MMGNETCASRLCPNASQENCAGCSKGFCEKHLVYLEPKAGFTPEGWRCKTCLQQLLVKTGKSRIMSKWVSVGALLALIVWLGNIPGLSTAMGFLGLVGILLGPGLYLALSDAYSQQLAAYQKKYREPGKFN